MAFLLYCINCGKSFDPENVRFFCDCGGLLDINSDTENNNISLADFDIRLQEEIPGCGSGVWRYREMVLPDVTEKDIITLNEGNTRLYSSDELSDWLGVSDLQIKHEGENPTGSFKDRGMTVAVTRARQQEAEVVACASTGNTSASMAAYAARAGLKALVLIPEKKVAAGKLAQALAYGAVTVEIQGDFDAGMTLIKDAARDGWLYPMNSVNPYRIEGQKTVIWEILQQRKWDPPDWIVFPAGNLGNYSAFGKAIHQMFSLGLIRKKPRLAGIQAEGANPFYKAFCSGFKKKYTVKADTLATAIRIGDPANLPRAVRAVKWTDGIVEEVTDQEIMDAKSKSDSSGIGAEPSSNASLAGIKKLIKKGIIQSGQSVVAILTGNILKDTDAIISYHSETLAKIKSRNPNRIKTLLPEMGRLRKLLEEI